MIMSEILVLGVGGTFYELEVVILLTKKVGRIVGFIEQKFKLAVIP